MKVILVECVLYAGRSEEKIYQSTVKSKALVIPPPHPVNTAQTVGSNGAATSLGYENSSRRTRSSAENFGLVRIIWENHN